MMNITGKLYPTVHQMSRIQQHIDVTRGVYNLCLEMCNNAQDNSRKRLDKYDLIPVITELKRTTYPWIRTVDSQTVQQSIIRLSRAFDSYFRLRRETATNQRWKYKKKKTQEDEEKRFREIYYPKFKSRRASSQSYLYPQRVKYNETFTKIFLPGVGRVKFRGYRDIPGEIKQCTVKVYNDGRVEATVTIDNENQVSYRNTGNSSVGIDVGTRKFLADSDGRIVPPFDYNKLYSKIEKQQQRLARSMKGSKNYERTRQRLTRLCRKLTNQRKDNLHKLANTYLHYRNVYVEDLKIQEMTENTVGTIEEPNIDSQRKTNLNDTILSQSWGMFFMILKYKLLARGSNCYKVDPMFTSQICSCCGACDKSHRKDEDYHCKVCGHQEDADINAAKNIRLRGWNEYRIEDPTDNNGQGLTVATEK